MNMKMMNNLPKVGKKGTLVGLVVSFVAMIALVGMYTFDQYQVNMQEQLAKNEAQKKEDAVTELVIPSEHVNTDKIVNPKVEQKVDESTTSNQEETKEKEEMNKDISEQGQFSEESILMWPVSGGVIMKYSMDESIYFETLDQYKRNAAMIIDGEVGMEVLSSERGVVVSVEETAQTGTTVIMDMGNKYSTVYGQLTDVKVKPGNLVEKGQIIGVLAEPTNHYSVEGCNLYFQLLKEGNPIDPLNYLE